MVVWKLAPNKRGLILKGMLDGGQVYGDRCISRGLGVLGTALGTAGVEAPHSLPIGDSVESNKLLLCLPSNFIYTS